MRRRRSRTDLLSELSGFYISRFSNKEIGNILGRKEIICCGSAFSELSPRSVKCLTLYFTVDDMSAEIRTFELNTSDVGR